MSSNIHAFRTNNGFAGSGMSVAACAITVLCFMMIAYVTLGDLLW